MTARFLAGLLRRAGAASRELLGFKMHATCQNHLVFEPLYVSRNMRFMRA